MRKIKYLLFLIFVSMFLSGCFATRQDAINIRLELRSLHQELAQIKKNQADMITDIEQQTTYLMQIGGKVDESNDSVNNQFNKISFKQDTLKELTQRLQGVEDRLYKLWVSTMPLRSALPEEIYETAREDFDKGRYDVAESGFKKFLQDYPNTEFAVYAQYGLADSLYMQEKWQDAIQKYDIFLNLYSTNELAPRALLKKAICLKALGEHIYAKKVLELIINKFPDTEDAKYAKEEMDTVVLND
ncbi:MAG: tol-pal system protein YbgF [Elusimicrobiota bacterium]